MVLRELLLVGAVSMLLYSHQVCKLTYLVPVLSQDILGWLCQKGYLA